MDDLRPEYYIMIILFYYCAESEEKSC